MFLRTFVKMKMFMRDAAVSVTMQVCLWPAGVKPAPER
jgi:hypothetical protein